MLVANMAEVCEPYTYEYINSLSDQKETLTRADGINLCNTLSLHLMSYIKNTQLNKPDAEDHEIVAEDEPPEDSTDPSGNLTDNNCISVSGMPALGKTKKDKEKSLRNGYIHEHLIATQ